VKRLLLTSLLLSTVAHAQVIVEQAPPPFPNPKKFARGFFAQGEIGTLIFLGPTARYASPGVNVGARIGYDLFRWLAIQGHFAGSMMNANLPAPTTGQSFQTLLYAAEVRLSVQIRRVQLYAQGGAGIGQLSNNVLDRVMITNGTLVSFAVVAGGGIDLHTLNRHFSLGLGADYVWLQNFSNTSGLLINAYLKYTH
jgi:hypothetical protein